jgi:acyl-CoA dehydrogenase
MSAMKPSPDLGRIGLSELQADLIDQAQRFCRERSPISRVRQLMTDETGYDPRAWQEIVELGWLGVGVPESSGGIGLSLGDLVPVVEQMGRTLMAGPFVSSVLAAQALVASSGDTMAAPALGRILGGAPATLALREAHGDVRPAAITARAERRGSDLVLSGRKVLVSDAEAAQLFVVSAMLEGRPVLVVVPRERLPGDALRPETLVDETRRSCSFDLHGVVVDARQLLDPDRAHAALSHVEMVALLFAAADMVGGAHSAVDLTVDYLKTRKQFGKLIGSYQALKHPTVEAYVRYEQARAHLYAAAHCFNEQGPGEIAVRMARVTAEYAYAFAADRAIQFHGGFGFTYDCDAQLYRRRAQWHAATSGDALHHKRRLAELVL